MAIYAIISNSSKCFDLQENGYTFLYKLFVMFIYSITIHPIIIYYYSNCLYYKNDLRIIKRFLSFYLNNNKNAKAK